MNDLLAMEVNNILPTREVLVDTLRRVYDPEISVNIYDLGLIYRIDVDDSGKVEIDMTLTAPACPVAGTLPHEVGRVIDAVPGVRDTVVTLVWQPPWSQELISDEAKLQLGLF
ncbi:MAG: DUF59 domain-containing protein [Candidatus Thiodiazotropha sp. (ex Rostrolucina anterorostrata)]|nr:DUF59 domain-containing protein [Candidatus Thiodiazotropha sp. (ex Rostrolucina anterorostrata)]